MHARKRLLIILAAFAAAGLSGCLNSPDSSEALVPVTEAEIQSAISAARSGDSLAPVRPIVCDTLKARLAALDSTAPQFAGIRMAVSRVCRVRPLHPDTLRPDTTRPDTVRPVKPDTLRPRPPKPPRPDSVRADSVGHHKPDSAGVKPPKAPKPPRPDTTQVQ